MSKRIPLGGKWDGLYVVNHKDRYEFYNHKYSMFMNLYKEDIPEYISHPGGSRWGLSSCSNMVDDIDKAIIKEYIINNSRKYKTVTDVLKSKSRKKEKILRENFSLNELVEYKMKGESYG